MRTRVLSLLSLAVGVSQAYLRGDNVEMVGDHIEFEPDDGYGIEIDRSMIPPRRATEVEEALVEDTIEDFDDEDIYYPDETAVEVEGTSLFDEDEEEEVERRQTECGSSLSFVEIAVKLDNNPNQFSYKLINSNNEKLLSGPANGKVYKALTEYSGGKCLPPGQYTLRAFDKAGNGICCGDGSGYIKVFVNGVLSAKEVGASSWRRKDIKFTIAPGSGRNSLPSVSGGSSSNSNFCFNTKIFLKVDKFGEETTVKVFPYGSSTPLMKIDPVVESYGTMTIQECLPKGRYKLVVEDFDGICCKNGEGEFILSINGEKLLEGGSFVKSISYDFLVGNNWEASMTQRESDYLVAHNVRRANWHRKYGKQPRKLRWSEGLQRNAQAYANQLLSTCSDNGIHHMDGLAEGENLAKNRGTGSYGQLYPADNIVGRFIDREVGLPWMHNAHLTQGLWYSTDYLGCADSMKKMDNGAICRIQVCRYARAGNCQMGQYKSSTNDNWKIPMMMDKTPCGPICPEGGCFL